MAGSFRNGSKSSPDRGCYTGKATDSGHLCSRTGPESNSELYDAVDVGSEGHCVR